MEKPCTIFPNCKPIADMLHIPLSGLYANIRVYNNYVDRYNRSHTEVPLKKISPDIQYTEEELRELSESMHAYFTRRFRDKDFDRSEIKSFAKEYSGSTEAYAVSAIENSSLTNGEISDVTMDIARNFVSSLMEVQEILRNKNNQQKTLSEIIRDRKPSSIFEIVRRKMLMKIAEAQKIVNENNNNVGNYTTEQVEHAQKVVDLGHKFLSEESQLFNELCVLSLSQINQMLDTRINADFILENPVRAEEIANVEDLEEPTVEHWYDILDHRAPESSVSKIIKRTLLLSPKLSRISTTKYVLEVVENGRKILKEYSKEEAANLSEKEASKLRAVPSYESKIVRTTIMESPYASTPNQEARRLFKVLQFATDEEDMIKILENNDYYKDSLLLMELRRDSRLRTTFFNDFNKYFQEMESVQYSQNSDGTINASTPSLNKDTRQSIFQRFKSALILGNKTPNTFFVPRAKINIDEEAGSAEFANRNNVSVDFRAFTITKDFFYKNFTPSENGGLSVFDRSFGTNQRTNLLEYLLDALNISVGIDELSDIANNKNKSDFIVKQAKIFFDFLSEKDLFNPTSHPKEAKNVLSTIESYDKLRNPIVKIMATIMPKAGYNGSGNNMVRYCGSSLTSRIMQSGWANFIKKVNSYGKDKLLDFIESRYAISENFFDDGSPLNTWIRDIIESADSEVGGDQARNLFAITRCLGIDDKKFEDISSREHMLSILFSYIQHRNFDLENTSTDAVIRDNILYTKDESGEYTVAVPREQRAGRTYRIVNQHNKYVTYTTLKDVHGKPILAKNNNPQEAIDEKSQSEVNDFAMIPMFITGDTNQLRMFRTPHYTKSQILDGIYGLYLSDQIVQETIDQFDKIGIMVSSNGKESMTKRGNKTKFGILTFLNDKKFLSRKDVKDIIGESELNSLTEDQVKALAELSINAEFEDFYNNQIVNLGCLEQIDGKYKYFDYLVSSLDTKELQEEKLRDYFEQFFFDYKFGMYNQIHLAHITTLAFNGTEDVQKRNKAIATNGTPLSADAEINGERLFENFSNLVVYFKDVNSAIDDDSMEKISEFVRTEYGKDHTKAEVSNMIKFFTDTFKKNSLTDGQAYRSFDSYRKILAAAGENFWSQEQENAYQRINEIVLPARQEKRNLTISEIQEIEDLMVVMQPIKPINDGIETISYTNGDSTSSVSIGFQFKYAEVPLIPELYPIGSKLREIGTWMINNHVDMICSDKCLKKGSFAEIDIQYKAVNGQYVDANGNVLPGYNQDLELVDNPTMAEQRRYIDSTGKDGRVEYGSDISFEEIISNQTVAGSRDSGYMIHTISLDNYLIQNNIPDHSSGTVVYGTQGRKIIGSLIKDDESYEFTVNGKKITKTGKELFAIWNMLHTAKYAQSFEQFISLINDPQRLTRNLSFLMRNNDRVNTAILSKIMLDVNGNPIVPYSEAGNQHDIINSIVSIFKKIVVRQQIHGGNIVQASALGCGKTAIEDPDLKPIFDKNGVLTGMEVEMPFIFETKDEDGNIIRLRYEDWCNDDGSFKTDEDGNTLIEKRYPGILDFTMNRIPTEGAYSMYHAHIKRCNPKTGANTIKMPLISTKISDFDFDIDKMFLHMRMFTESFKEIEILDENGQKVDVDSKIWDDIYNEYPNYKLKLLLAKRNSSKEEREELAKKKGVPVGKLHLNHYWELADIKRDKQDVYDEFYNRYSERAISKVSGSKFEFDSDDSQIKKMSSTDIDNAIIDIEEAVLSHKSTMLDRITPGGFDTMKDDGRMIRLIMHPEVVPGFENGINSEEEYNRFIDTITKDKSLDYKDEFDPFDPITIILYKQWNQIAGQEIGVFANENVNDAISKRLLEFSISDQKNAILFGSLINQEANIDGDFGRDPQLGLSFQFASVNGRVLSKALHELLGSSVDAVKDNALISLGLNGVTGDVGAMLVRLGYSTFDLGLLFNQPIVKEACDYMAKNSEKNFSNAIKICVKKYVRQGIDPNSIFQKDIDKSRVSSKSLALALTHGDNQTQVEVAKLIVKISGVKQDLSTFVSDTRNTSANSVTTDFGGFLSKTQKHEKYLRKSQKEKKISIVAQGIKDNGGYPITDDWKSWSIKTIAKDISDFMDKYKDHPFTYENALYNFINFGMNIMMNKFTPFSSDVYARHRDALSRYVAPWGIDGDHINEFHMYLPGLILSKLDGDFNPAATNNPLGISNREYYLKRIFDLLDDDELAQDEDFVNFFTNYIESQNVRSGKEGAEQSEQYIRIKNVSGAESLEKFDITKAYGDIIKKGGKFAEAFKALYLHNYYIRGLNPSSNQMMELAPVNVLQMLVASELTGTSYLDVFTKIGIDDLSSRIDDDAVEANALKYIIYHSDDQSLVPSIPVRRADIAVDDKTIVIKGDNIRKCYLCRTENNALKQAYFRPIIKVEGKLYALTTAPGKEYFIGSSINNILDSNADRLYYTEVQSYTYSGDGAESYDDYSGFFSEYNNFIFENYNMVTPLDHPESDNSDDSDTYSGNEPTGKEAANNVDTSKKMLDAENQEECN